MRITDNVGELSPRRTAALVGTLALCCVVPMLLVFGVVSAAGALFGGAALVVVGLVSVLVWAARMGQHHRQMSHDDARQGDGPIDDLSA